jgi:adenylyltransferase/sulfurtransferase
MKIVKAKVAVVGAGGIGCPLALYLAAAGVGTIGLFDSDKVDVTNLHRQVGHRTSTVGIEKTNSLKMTLLGINPFIKIK